MSLWRNSGAHYRIRPSRKPGNPIRTNRTRMRCCRLNRRRQRAHGVFRSALCRTFRFPCILRTMRSSTVCAVISAFLVSCGSSQKPPAVEAQKAAEPAPPSDESARLPKPNLVSSEVVANHLLGKRFMPGGTLGHYKKGKLEYEIFVARLPSSMDAAVLLPRTGGKA